MFWREEENYDRHLYNTVKIPAMHCSIKMPGHVPMMTLCFIYEWALSYHSFLVVRDLPAETVKSFCHVPWPLDAEANHPTP